MSVREKLSRGNSAMSYEEWRRNLRKSFWLLIGGLSSAWIIAGLFTVWLLAR
ncbi:MAG: hypothetical protein IJQ75_04015 [Synergistaceae bacterium]|nr:hypothetical protein [Synergistaceae bacterium]